MNNKTKSNTQQAFWVGIGSLCSFGFTLISAAILSRYLTKDEYGTYKQVMYVYNTLLVVFTLGLPRAYSFFLPRVSIQEGLSLIKKISICFILLGLVFSVVLFLGSGVIANILNNSQLKEAMKLFSPTPVFLLPTMGLEGILATYRKTELNAIYSFATRFLSIIFVALPVIFYNSSCEIAIMGFTLSSVFTCIIGFYFMHLPFEGIDKKKTEISLKEIFTFTIPLMFAGFWGIAEKSADQFFISRWFGESVFADFANGSLELPFVGMILSAGSVVLLPIFSKLATNKSNKKEIISIWQRTAVKAASILYPLVIFSWFFSDIMMTFLYGEEYIDSGKYFKIMLTINIFTVAQYYPILLATGKTKLYSNVLMISAVTVWILEFTVISLFKNPYLITIVDVVVRICKIMVFLIFIARISECKIRDLFPLHDLSKIFISSMISGLISFLVINYLLDFDIKFLSLIVGFIIFLICELPFALVLHIPYLDIIKPIYKLKKH